MEGGGVKDCHPLNPLCMSVLSYILLHQGRKIPMNNYSNNKIMNSSLLKGGRVGNKKYKNKETYLLYWWASFNIEYIFLIQTK